MNVLDISILTLIGISVVFGLYRGLVREIFSLLALVSGFLAAAWYYSVPASFLQGRLFSQTWANVTGFILIFIGVIFVIGLIGTLMRRFLKHAHLDFEDRLLGGVFGFIKGLFVTTILIGMLLTFMPASDPLVAESKTLPYFVRLAAVIKKAIPDKLKTAVDEKKKDFFEFWEEQKRDSKET